MTKLAIDGGEMAVTINQDCLKWPIIPEDAKETIMELLNKVPGEVSLSRITDMFADEFGEYMDADFAIPLNNGTAGLFSAYACIDIKPGDEVICPSYTYWATAMPAAYLGAKIVFAEIDPDTLCIDPEDIRKKITPKTKCITPVHVWGMACDMDSIMEMAQENNIKVIEDASHAHGASYHGKKLGTIGDLGVYSLQGSKLMPAGEAGMLLTNNNEYYEKALAIGHYERVKGMYMPEDSPYKKYGATTLMGMKFRMSPLHAAIALSYLETLDEDNAMRTKNCERVRAVVRKMPGFKAFVCPDDIQRVYYENLIEYNEEETNVPAEKIVEALQAEGAIVSKNRYYSLHQKPYFLERGHTMDELPRTVDIESRLITLPKFSVNNDELVDQYILALEKVSENLLN